MLSAISVASSQLRTMERKVHTLTIVMIERISTASMSSSIVNPRLT